MKQIIIFLFAFFLLGCNQPHEEQSKAKGLPRIEFIECESSISDFSLERKIYLNKEVSIVGDTTIISYGFVRDCCLEFEGKWKMENNQLNLSYQPKGSLPPCECKCMYTMKYHFNNKEYSWERIKIKNN